MLNPDFRDMSAALCDVQAEFLVVGAYAMSAHGVPRSTGDIDGLSIPDLGPADLVSNKQACGRTNAPADVELLRKRTTS